MNRLRQWVFSALTWILPFVCIATALAWVRSYWARDAIFWTSRYVVTATGSSANERYFVSDGGTAVIGWESATWTGPTAPFGFANASRRGLSFATQSHPAEIVSFGFWGDNFVDAQDTYTNHVHLVRVPWWSLFLATLLASLPLVLWRVRDRQRRWRLRRGLCVSCGYDLRGTPERCPECGTVPTSVKSAL